VKAHFEKAGSIGAVLAAAACPVCFPKLALIGALFGLGALGAYESQLFIAVQVLATIAVAGHALASLQRRSRWRLSFALLSGAAVFAGLYLFGSEALVYAGFAGLVALSGIDLWTRLRQKRMPESGMLKSRLESVITCPKCGHGQRETMPAESCQFFYECTGCGTLLRPKPGDCCVFCSYGSVRCPPMQTAAPG
jgi:hypothetical protein